MSAHDSTQDQARARRRRLSALGIRFAFTLVILAYLALRIDWVEFWRRLQQSDPFYISLACALVGVTYAVNGFGWWLLLRVQEIFLPLKLVLRLTLIGQFFNAYLLGAMGGEAVKVVYLWRLVPEQKIHGTVSILMDRAIGSVVLLCFAVGTLPWQFDILMKREETRVIAFGLAGALAAVLVGGIAIAVIPFHRAPSLLRKLWRKIPRRHIIELLIAAFRRHGGALWLTAGAVACSIVTFLILALAALYLAYSIGLEISYAQMLMILSVVIAAISLPISIGGHGVREGVFALMFVAFGIADAGAAVLYSLLYFALFLVWSAVGGSLYIGFRGHGGPREGGLQ